ncbi:Conserved_hypothetical protein [Hexamita inflata]|uniref:Uncharacterized protein n=1 Tax=Hexamita inflata TaxID=28002 RepID=A0AA86V212_9EUKA|nr:Conserved hypothetical protein [Hexamita inflata]
MNWQLQNFIDSAKCLLSYKVYNDFLTVFNQLPQQKLQNRIQWLQFILEISSFLSDFPELLSVFTQFLSDEWKQFCFGTLKICSIDETAEVFGLKNASEQKFQEIINNIKENTINQTQQEYRTKQSASIKQETKKMWEMMGILQGQMKCKKDDNGTV